MNSNYLLILIFGFLVISTSGYSQKDQVRQADIIHYKNSKKHSIGFILQENEDSTVLFQNFYTRDMGRFWGIKRYDRNQKLLLHTSDITRETSTNPSLLYLPDGVKPHSPGLYFKHTTSLNFQIAKGIFKIDSKGLFNLSLAGGYTFNKWASFGLGWIAEEYTAQSIINETEELGYSFNSFFVEWTLHPFMYEKLAPFINFHLGYAVAQKDSQYITYYNGERYGVQIGLILATKQDGQLVFYTGYKNLSSNVLFINAYENRAELDLGFKRWEIGAGYMW